MDIFDSIETETSNSTGDVFDQVSAAPHQKYLENYFNEVSTVTQQGDIGDIFNNLSESEDVFDLTQRENDLETLTQQANQLDPVEMWSHQQRAMGVPEEEIQAEIGGLKESWIQPTDALMAGAGAGSKLALAGGKKLLPAIGRGLVSGGVSGVAEYPIGITAESLEEDHPALAFLTAIGLGLALGITVEQMAERGILNVAKKVAEKYPRQATSKLPKEVINRFFPKEPFNKDVDSASEGIKFKLPAEEIKPIEKVEDIAVKQPRKHGIISKAAQAWDEKVAEPFINLLKEKTNGLIVHEDLRNYLGLSRSKELQNLMRDYTRDIDRLWTDAAEIGRELKEIAPTSVEQKRLMQVVRGGISGNPELQAKANKVRDLFDELRENLKEHKLLQYSRFDKLTRKELSKLHKVTRLPDPETITDANNMIAYAANIGLKRPPVDRSKFVQGARNQLQFYRDRLHDYYHFGSAQEYAPIYYKKFEGLTPEQRKVLSDEINELKVKSRRGNPEGKQEIEALITRLESMLGRGFEARRQQKATYRGLVKGYAHQRIEMPVEVQRVMGLIEEAPFPVAKGLGIQATDIRKAKLFEDIKNTPGWVIRPNPRVEIPANYHLIEDERFGPLNNMFIRKDIWNDLKEVEEMRSWFVQNWDKTLGWWKYGKVVLNPATHMRNAYSNAILAYLGDVNLTDVKTWKKATMAIKGQEKNRYFREAKDWGLFNNTFYSAEINKLRDELSSVRDPQKLKSFIRSAFSIPAELYQTNEKFFKMAVYIKARDSGMSVDEAAKKAEKFLFNYSDIPPWVKHMKRWVSPFFTFTYKAVPLFGEMAIRKPWKVGSLMAAMYGIEEFSRRQLGMTKEEHEEQRNLLPEWQKRKAPPGFGPYANVLMPFKDKWGNNLYLDLAYILPYGNVAEKWDQSALPLADLLPSNPLFQISAAILTNKKPFTGQSIYNEILDGSMQVCQKYLEYAWKEMTPSMAPGGYNYNKLMTGFKNTFMGKEVLDWADRPIEFQTALLSSLMGIKLSPANEKKLLQFELGTRNKIIKSVSREKYNLATRYRRNEITKEEYHNEVDKLLDLKKKLLKERSKK